MVLRGALLNVGFSPSLPLACLLVFFISLPFDSFISMQAFPVYNLSKPLTNRISRGILIVHAACSIHNAHCTVSIT